MLITLLDGSKIESGDLSLDRGTYQVWAFGVEEVTDLMRQADKLRVFPGFDREKDNARASDDARRAAGQAPIRYGSTSLIGNFTTQILTKPLDAPLEALDNTTKKIFKSTGVRVLIALAVVALLVYLSVQFGGIALIKKFFKK